MYPQKDKVSRQEYQREYHKQWYLKNKEIIRKQRIEKRKKWNKGNRDKVNASKRKYYLRHRGLFKAQRKRYVAKYPQIVRKLMRKYGQKVKLEVLTYYGGGKVACVKCGFSDIRALSIDHIDGGGTHHRVELHHRNIYAWLRKNNYPEGYQTLCMNCQFIKRCEGKELASG